MCKELENIKSSILLNKNTFGLLAVILILFLAPFTVQGASNSTNGTGFEQTTATWVERANLTVTTSATGYIMPIGVFDAKVDMFTAKAQVRILRDGIVIAQSNLTEQVYRTTGAILGAEELAAGTYDYAIETYIPSGRKLTVYNWTFFAGTIGEGGGGGGSGNVSGLTGVSPIFIDATNPDIPEISIVGTISLTNLPSYPDSKIDNASTWNSHTTLISAIQSNETTYVTNGTAYINMSQVRYLTGTLDAMNVTIGQKTTVSEVNSVAQLGSTAQVTGLNTIITALYANDTYANSTFYRISSVPACTGTDVVQGNGTGFNCIEQTGGGSNYTFINGTNISISQDGTNVTISATGVSVSQHDLDDAGVHTGELTYSKLKSVLVNLANNVTGILAIGSIPTIPDSKLENGSYLTKNLTNESVRPWVVSASNISGGTLNESLLPSKSTWDSKVTTVQGNATGGTTSSGGTSPIVSCTHADASTYGCINGTEFTTFNGKEGNISYGTTAQFYRGNKTFTPIYSSDISLITGNMWFNQTIFNTYFSGKSTTDLSEGTNKYFSATNKSALDSATSTNIDQNSSISGLQVNDTTDRAYVNNTFLPILTYSEDFPNSTVSALQTYVNETFSTPSSVNATTQITRSQVTGQITVDDNQNATYQNSSLGLWRNGTVGASMGTPSLPSAGSIIECNAMSDTDGAINVTWLYNATGLPTYPQDAICYANVTSGNSVRTTGLDIAVVANGYLKSYIVSNDGGATSVTTGLILRRS